MQEGSYKQHLHLLHSRLGDGCEGVKQAVVLMKVWLAQRESLRASDSLDGFSLLCLAAFLLQEKRLNARMDALPALMVMLSFLAQNDLTATGTAPLALKGDSCPLDPTFFPGAFVACLLLQETGVNAFASLSRSACAEIQKEAATALELLQTNARTSATALFLTPLPFLRAFDYYIRLPLHQGEGGQERGDAVSLATARVRVYGA